MSTSVLQSPRRWWRTGARLALGISAVASLGAACSDPASPPGYREYTATSGKGGGGASATAGTKAASGEGGEAVGGAADGGAPAQGGRAGNAGTGGGAGGGLGGGGKGGGGGSGGSSGGPGTTCGNDTLDPGEACDDGNKLDFDGCSSACKNKCEKCLDTFYGKDADYLEYVNRYRNSMDPAIEGPAIATPRSVLAQDLVHCIVESECLFKDPTLQGACLCGTASDAECDAGMSDSPCIDEFGDAAEAKDGALIKVRLTNPTLAVGWAAELTLVQGGRGYCLDACKADRDVTPCELCLAGPTTSLNPPVFGCTACLTPGVCSTALIACAEEKCADGNMEPCLGKAPQAADEIALKGPCKDSVVAAGSNFFPATADFLRCKASQCKTECFAP